MNDYVQNEGPDSLDQAERDNARYEAERAQSDADWEREREDKIAAKYQQMSIDPEYVQEALSDIRVTELFFKGSSNYVLGALILAVVDYLLLKMAEEEIDKEYS